MVPAGWLDEARVALVARVRGVVDDASDRSRHSRLAAPAGHALRADGAGHVAEGDLLYAVVTGQRNHENSARKSAATRDGSGGASSAERRSAPVPLGHRVDSDVVDGHVMTRRIPTHRRPLNITPCLNGETAHRRWAAGFTAKPFRRVSAVRQPTGDGRRS